jgi:hypothetical protein
MGFTMAKTQTAGVGNDAVAKATGKTWDQWCKLLDADGCATMTHKEIVAVLDSKHRIGPWWQQMVTVGYEQARGLRVKHQKTDGFSVSRSKTLDVPIALVFAAWSDKRKRARWLSDPGFTIRKATANRSLRIKWVDGKTNVEVMFYTKGAGKTQVTVQHNRLTSARDATKLKAYWGTQLDKLHAILEK